MGEWRGRGAEEHPGGAEGKGSRGTPRGERPWGNGGEGEQRRGKSAHGGNGGEGVQRRGGSAHGGIEGKGSGRGKEGRSAQGCGEEGAQGPGGVLRGSVYILLGCGIKHSLLVIADEPEQFAVKFKNPELAQEFKRKFEEAQQFVIESQANRPTPSASQSADSLGETSTVTSIADGAPDDDEAGYINCDDDEEDDEDDEDVTILFEKQVTLQEKQGMNYTVSHHQRG